jgi:hypothetical protein
MASICRWPPEIGEHRVDRLEGGAPRQPEDGGGELQVFGDAEVGEDVLRLRHEGQPLEDHAVRGHAGDVPALQQDLAGADRHEPGHGLHEGGLARAVGPEDGEDLALIDPQRRPAHDRQARVVSGFEVTHLQRRAGRHADSPR